MRLKWAGWKTTAALRSTTRNFGATLIKYLPEQRLLKPEELGGALLYLVSPAAAYVTGQSIAIDGGLLCRV